MSPPLRASNEGFLKPRVARAQGTHRAIRSMLADFFNILLGIRSALHVPVTQGSQEGESALFQGVAERISRVAPMNGAAFCSRRGNSTVVNRVSLSCLFG